MFNTSEVSNEYNLLNDFLSNSLMEDSNLYSAADMQGLFPDQNLTNTMGALPNNNAYNPNAQNNSLLLPPPAQAAVGNSISRPPRELDLAYQLHIPHRMAQLLQYGRAIVSSAILFALCFTRFGGRLVAFGMGGTI